MASKLQDRRRRHDQFYRQAKQQSYRARSVFKLQQIDQRFRLFRRGQRVLDLGCRPGSWMQYAAEVVGPRGLVVGIDRQPLDVDLGPNTRTLVGDVYETEPQTLRGDCPCFHVVLSDMAPDTSGIAFTDKARSVELFLRAFELSLELGCPSGSFVAKVFMGDGFDEALARVKKAYARTKTYRPEATRKESSEFYVVAQERKPAR